MPARSELFVVEQNAERRENSRAPTTTLDAWDYEEVLNVIGFGQTQWIMLLTAGLLLMLVINESMGMSVITIASQCDFATNSVEKAMMSAAFFVGVLCSSYLCGYLSDTIGRRPVLIYTTLIGNVISFLSLFMPSYWIFVFLRFLVGFFVAGASSTTYAYLGEFNVTRYRPVVINYASMFVGIAVAYVPAVAWIVLSMNWSLPITQTFSLRPWRLLIIFNLLPGFLAVLILLTLPESPKFLLSVQKQAEALAATNWICQRNIGRSLKDLKVYKLKDDFQLERAQLVQSTPKTAYGTLNSIWQETRPLFRRPHVLNFLISCVVMCGLFFCGSGLGLWYTEIQNRVGEYADSEGFTVCQAVEAMIMQKTQYNTTSSSLCEDSINTKSYIDSITIGFFYIVGFIVLGVIINPLGRKLLIIAALTVSGLCGLALFWISNPVSIVIDFCLFLVLPSLCISVLSGAVVDLVPTHLRGKAVCICLMLGRSGSVFGSSIVGALLETSCNMTFSIFITTTLVCAALTFVLPI